MEKNEIKTEHQHSQKNWYDKTYKWLLIIPAILFIISLAFLYSFFQTHGDIINKDVSLTGGTTISVFDSNANLKDVESALKQSYSDLSIRSITDIQSGGQKGFTIETKSEADEVKASLEEFLGYSLTSDNSSVEFSGSNLSAGFYQQLRNSLIAAFLLMSFVVFFVFGEDKKIKAMSLMLTALGLKLMLPQVGVIVALCFVAIIAAFIYAMFVKPKTRKWNIAILVITALVILAFFFYQAFWLIIPIGITLTAIYGYYSIPSLAVITSAFVDIVMTVALVDYLGMTLSTAGIVGFLMIIGYSVDTDILLTTRLLKKKEGSVNSRLYGAFKTGMTMSVATIAAVGVALIVIGNSSETLRQIFTIILIGTGFDIMNTWITNASLLKWYVEAKKSR